MSNARELAELASSYGGGVAMGNRNVIINGGMQVAQRTIGPTAATFYTYNTADRMRFSNSGGTSGSWTQEVVTNQDVGDFVGNALKTTCTSAGGSGNVAGLNIRLELQDLQRFAGKQMTLSFYAKSDAPVTMTPAVFGDSTATMDTFTFTPTYTRYVTTFTVPSLSTVTFFDLAMRVDGTVATSHYITGIQLEAGPVATPFEHRQYGQELALCQRYYWRSGGGSNDYYYTLLVGGTSFRGIYPFPVTMRAAPTLTYATNSGTISAIYAGSYNTFRVHSETAAAIATDVTANAEL